MSEYKPRSIERKRMYARAGARERYAMENGHPTTVVDGERVLIRFTYSEYDPYQDANGATYDVGAGKWVG